MRTCRCAHITLQQGKTREICMKFTPITSAESIVRLVDEIGFLPLFGNEIDGFSVEDNCPKYLWFTDVDGPWEWKGPVAHSGQCLYGKFFRNKAGFVSADWFADFANYRRNGYDFDSLCDEGLAEYNEEQMFNRIAQQGAVLSKKLKRDLDYRKGGKSGFDGVITKLQMQTYLTIDDFVYMQDKNGKTYGWGVAVYTTPEYRFGYERITAAYKREPEQSLERIVQHLCDVFGAAQRDKIIKIIK